jgi:hypothetical protein
MRARGAPRGSQGSWQAGAGGTPQLHAPAAGHPGCQAVAGLEEARSIPLLTPMAPFYPSVYALSHAAVLLPRTQ